MRRKPAPWWALLLADTALLAVALGGYMLTQQILPALSAPPPTAVVSPPPAQEEAGPEEEQADSPEDPPSLTWAQRFAQHFSPTVETGDGYYRSPGLSITVTAHTQGSAEEGDLLTWYVADIYLADIGSFQTVLAGGRITAGAPPPIPWSCTPPPEASWPSRGTSSPTAPAAP